MRRIPEYFVRGLLFFIPLALTIFILKEIFFRIDGLLGLPLPGAGLVLSLIIITLIGFLTTNFITKRLLSLVETIFQNVPFVKLIYNSLRDLIEAFVGKKKFFDKPVMVKIFHGSEGKALGFITSEDLNKLGMTDHVVVYFPQSYNFAGQTLIFPRENVTPLVNISSTEIMTFIVSAGIARKHE